MTESTFTFRVDEELKSAFAEAAKAQDRTAAQLLRVLMREAVEREQTAREHDEWFRAEVEEAIREADDPNTVWVSNEDAEKRWAKLRAELIQRLKDEEAQWLAAE
jgi:predicted transcriptional regulator